MSSLVTAPEGAAPGEPRATHSTRVRTLGAGADLAVGLALAAGLCFAVFVATGGTDLGPNTWTQIVLLVIGTALATLVVMKGASGPAWGGVTLLLFGAVAALTAISIAWSVQPDNSWLEANRTLSYLAAFGGAMALSRLFPQRWPGVVGATALFATVVCAYALLVKVFPATFDPQETLGRLVAPLNYWNATGLVGALGLPACLWLGATRGRARVLRGLSVPAVAICATVVALSYSRSAVLAAIIGAGCWFVLVPLRLRGALVLALGLAGAAVLTGWALLTHPLTHDKVALASRTSAGHEFGVVVVLVLILFAGVGVLGAFAIDRVELAARTRRRLGTWLVALVILVPVGGGIAVLASSSRGVTGEISHVWSTLTSQTATVGDNPGRLGELASSRARDWNEGLKVGEHALLDGVGALGYATARNRYASERYVVHHAHSYVIETFADFGLIGLVLNLALLVAWGLATARTLGARPRDRFRSSRAPGGSATAPPSGIAPGPAATAPAGAAEVAAERAGLLTLLCVVVAFGVHSTIDWTWFIPGTALPALVCAGWLAGRGPLSSPVGRRPRRRRLASSPAAAASAIALTAVTLLAAWAIWQPLRSTDADYAAITAASAGNISSALANAGAAAARDPLALQPHWELSELYSVLGDQPAARSELQKAVDLQPENPDSWQQLGSYYLQHGQPQLALTALRKGAVLNINSLPTQQEIRQATAAMAAAQTAAARKR